jgi:hypothetical protein
MKVAWEKIGVRAAAATTPRYLEAMPRSAPLRFRIGPLTLAAVALLLLPACQSQTRTVRTFEASQNAGDPQRAVVEAPADLHDLAGSLLRYHVRFAAYPDRLSTLREAGMMPDPGIEAVADYAYHPQGLGTLAGGQRIMVVDRAVRIADHLWCILEIDRPTDVTAALDVRLVPWADLQAAARSAPR